MPADLWIFVTTLLVVYVLPGPDIFLVIDTATRYGRTRALAAAAGLAIARITHITLAAVGLAALLRASPTAFTVVRLIGAAYLVWLGLQILRAPSLSHQGGGAGALPVASPWLFFRRGLLTNALNPKALLFCSVLLPQFVDAEGGPIWLQFLVLGAICIGVGLAGDTLISFAGDRLGRGVRASPRAQRIQKWLFGGLLMAFGARLAFARL